MQFTLAELRLRPIPFAVSFPPGQLDSDADEWAQDSVIEATGRAELGQEALGEIRVSGELAGSVAVQCDRCQEEFSLPVSTAFDWSYLPVTQAPSAPEREIGTEDAAVGFYEASGVALRDVVRETILLELPMQILCREDCKGLCAICGQSLNESSCQCRENIVEDRWRALKSFRPSRGS